jgi:alpha-glucosidase (family GH31 glycosyl hydrolase)
MWDAVHTGAPLTRPLVYAFGDWRPGWRESFVHLLGDALLVAPVLEPGATVRRAQLPPGRWLELGTGIVHDGDAWADLAAPLGRPVWLLREGHALPLARVEAVAGEVVPPWLAGGTDAPPPPIRWLCFPDAAGDVRGDLVWEDGVTRAFAEGVFDRWALTGGGRGGPFEPRLRLVHAGMDRRAGVHTAYVPGGDERPTGLASGWTEVALAT